MPATLRKAAIVGVYETALERVPSRTIEEVYIEAVRGALDDAGITIKEVDGLIGGSVHFGTSQVGSSPFEREWNLLDKVIPASLFSEQFGTRLRYFDQANSGSQSGATGVFHAADAVATGHAEVVLVPGVLVRGSRPRAPEGAAGAGVIGRDQWEPPFGFPGVGKYAMAARRHMHEYGTTSAQLAQVAVIARKHAVLNPAAIMHSRGSFTVEDVLNSRMIYDPLHLLDCCITVDGGSAVIVATEERARGMKHRPVHVLGYGDSFSYMDMYRLPSLTTFADGVSSAKDAFSMAGVRHSDIDVVAISDHFTITPLIALEDIGFCKKGEGGPFVESGILELGGKMPMNTDGGYLSHGHIDLSVGMLNVIELVRQLRGEAGARQVRNARIGLYHGISGSFNSAHTAILARD